MQIKIYSILVVFILCLMSFSTVGAESLTAEQQNAIEEAVVIATTKVAKETAKATVEAGAERKFAGLDFGVGISLTVDTGKHDRIKSAEIVDGLVRVTTENNANARVMLESHYFFTPKKFFGHDINGNMGDDSKTFGVGPFIALQPGTDEIIESIGLGCK